MSRDRTTFVIAILVALLATYIGGIVAIYQGGQARTEDDRAVLAAPRDIHNDATKCRNHCHNAGLVVGSWDGAHPARHTEHGCRCTEGGEP